MTGEVCLDDDKFGQMGSQQRAKSSNQGCRMAAEQNFFHRWRGMTTIGYELGYLGNVG